MNKGLQALKDLKETCEMHMGRMVYILQEDKFELIEKELKAFEIIKKHLVLVKLDDGTEFFDLDLWNTKSQKEDFEFVKEYCGDDIQEQKEKIIYEIH